MSEVLLKIKSLKEEENYLSKEQNKILDKLYSIRNNIKSLEYEYFNRRQYNLFDKNINE